MSRITATPVESHGKVMLGLVTMRSSVVSILIRSLGMGIRASMALTDLVVVFHKHLLSLIINCTKVKLICQVGKSTYLFALNSLLFSTTTTSRLCIHTVHVRAEVCGDVH
jgi:hypothetical protein